MALILRPLQDNLTSNQHNEFNDLARTKALAGDLYEMQRI